MAHTVKLLDGWKLTDGFMEPFCVDGPNDVQSLLRERGLLLADPAYQDLLKQEWITSRTWVYSVPFDAPEEEDERYYIRIPASYGKGTVELNGKTLGSFDRKPCCFDATGAMMDGKNELRILFEAELRRPGTDDFYRRIGLAGAVLLESGGAVRLKDCAISMKNGTAQVKALLDAFVGGKTRFVCTFTPDEGESEIFTFTEKLRACEAEYNWEMQLRHPVPYRREMPEETSYLFRLEIERAGIGCARFDGKVANITENEVALCAAEAESHMEQLTLLGIDGIVSENPMDTIGLGLLDAKGEREEILVPALSDADAMLAFFGDDKIFPMGSGIWRYTASSRFDKAELEKVFGLNAAGDLRRACAFSRFLQAETLLRRCLRARSENRRILLREAAKNHFRCCGGEIIDSNGSIRPGGSAVGTALCKTQAYCDAPISCQAEESLSINFGLLGAVKNTLYAITAEVYDTNGASLSAITLPVYWSEAEKAGTLQCTMPESGACLVRITAKDDRGAMAARVDYTIVIEGKQVLDLPTCDVAHEDDKLINKGQYTAFGVAAGGFYGALLPGEEMTIDKNVSYSVLNKGFAV